jgi:hypothetical protein
VPREEMKNWIHMSKMGFLGFTIDENIIKKPKTK